MILHHEVCKSFLICFLFSLLKCFVADETIACVMIDWLVDWLIDLLVGWLIGWLVDWLMFDVHWNDWFVGWFMDTIIDAEFVDFIWHWVHECTLVFHVFSFVMGFWFVFGCELKIVYTAHHLTKSGWNENFCSDCFCLSWMKFNCFMNAFVL